MYVNPVLLNLWSRTPSNLVPFLHLQPPPPSILLLYHPQPSYFYSSIFILTTLLFLYFLTVVTIWGGPLASHVGIFKTTIEHQLIRCLHSVIANTFVQNIKNNIIPVSLLHYWINLNFHSLLHHYQLVFALRRLWREMNKVDMKTKDMVRRGETEPVKESRAKGTKKYKKKDCRPWLAMNKELLTWLESSLGGTHRDLLQHTLMLWYANFHGREKRQINKQRTKDNQRRTDTKKRHD